MTGRAHPEAMLPLVALVREKVTASGKSLRAFADDRDVPYSTIRYYHDKRLAPLSQPPRKETLRELALALDVPLGEVEQAALESLSYRTAPPKIERPADPPADEPPLFDVIHAIRNDPHLLPEAKEHLERQYGLLLRVHAYDPERVREEVTEERVTRLRAGRQPAKRTSPATAPKKTASQSAAAKAAARTGAKRPT